MPEFRILRGERGRVEVLLGTVSNYSNGIFPVKISEIAFIAALNIVMIWQLTIRIGSKSLIG